MDAAKYGFGASSLSKDHDQSRFGEAMVKETGSTHARASGDAVERAVNLPSL